MTTMDNQNNYQDDPKGVETWPETLKQTPFAVSSNYFDSLQKKILQRVRVIEATKNSFAIPPNYFEDFQQRLKLRIQIEEHRVEEKDLQLPNLPKGVSGFSVPDRYFESLENSLVGDAWKEKDIFTLKSGTPNTPKKIRQIKLNRWIGYAAAACIVLLLGSTLFFQLNHPPVYVSQKQANHTFQYRLDHIPETEIINYLEYYSEPEDALSTTTQLEDMVDISNATFSDKDIEAYLDYSL